MDEIKVSKRASPATVEKYLEGAPYPAGKSDLINQAKSNHAPSEVMYIINQFEDKQYKSPIDVSEEFGHVE